MTTLVATPRGHFAVDITGPMDAPPLMLVAGLGDDHTSWAPVLDGLANSYRCITFDNRGIGASPITPSPYTIADLAHDTHAIANALKLDRVTGVGSSMGAPSARNGLSIIPPTSTASSSPTVGQAETHTSLFSSNIG
jgi:3-oxoadipate enol-lactonase